MINLYNHTIGCCLSANKIKPNNDINEKNGYSPIKVHIERNKPLENSLHLNKLDLIYNNARINRDMTVIINNSFKEKSQKMKSQKINYTNY